jgi:nicotinate-nucleotide adenylyltransferase
MAGLNPLKRIGIFGGTFDPPHVGHQILAAEAYEQLTLDRILWVLTPDPPHKQDRSITPIECRLRLVEATIAGNDKFELSLVEIERQPPHYALDTVNALQAQHPESEMVYLIGGDSLSTLPDWHKPQEFVEACSSIGVMCRPGQQADLQRLEDVIRGISSKVVIIDAPLLEISSSGIRRRVASGKPYRYYLPEAVHRIIREQNLYFR